MGLGLVTKSHVSWNRLGSASLGTTELFCGSKGSRNSHKSDARFGNRDLFRIGLQNSSTPGLFRSAHHKNLFWTLGLTRLQMGVLAVVLETRCPCHTHSFIKFQWNWFFDLTEALTKSWVAPQSRPAQHGIPLLEALDEAFFWEKIPNPWGLVCRSRRSDQVMRCLAIASLG